MLMTLLMGISRQVMYEFSGMKTIKEQRYQGWIVYILRCSDGSFYTGATNDLEKRIREHNRGTASKYTRSRRPVTLMAVSIDMNKSEALRLEIKIKRLPKTRKINGLKNYRLAN
jgi:predicted GIY-YIG superfamily endonuclease